MFCQGGGTGETLKRKSVGQNCVNAVLMYEILKKQQWDKRIKFLRHQ